MILPTITQPLSSRPKLSNLTIATSNTWAFQVALVVKNPSANAGDTGDLGLMPGSRRSPGEGNGNPLQYSYTRNHGQKSLAGYSPESCKELDTTEVTWQALYVY